MDTDIKPAPQTGSESADTAAAASVQAMDVVAPPKSEESPNQSGADSAAPVEPPVETPAETAPAEQKKTDKLAEKPVPAGPKEPSNAPVGVIVAAVVMFFVLAALAYLAYSQK